MAVKSKPIIIGIGASAGGLEAIQEFFKNMPENTGLSFVVVQHLSPDYRSMMDELLSRHTKIKIEKVEDGMIVLPDTIYLIPPRKNMSVYHGKLYLEEQDHKKGLNLPIDIFFRSLAAETEKKSIGIILSGTGSDGTLGVKAIKEAGGMIMVQDRETAKFDGMPGSSIATGLVDYILPPAQMPEALINFIQHPFVDKENSLKKQMEQSVDTLSKILLILRDYIGVDFSYYKENTIIRRLERRLSINRFNNLEQYLKLLMESNKEKDILYRELLIGVTRFFRDQDSFDALAKNVYPQLFKDKDKNQIRLWVAGCSTGEEVYSLAITLTEFVEKHNLSTEIKIFATDIDRHAIEFAGNGIYPESIVADVPAEYITKYFIRKDTFYQISESIRKKVVFASHNVLKDPPFSKIDLISCRNLFIYFKPEVQSRVLSMFYFSLNSNGFLFMGNSETVGDLSEAFSSFDTKHKIFRYAKGYKAKLVPELTMPKVAKSDSQNKNEKSFKNNGITIKNEFFSEKILGAFVPPSVIIDSSNTVISVVNDVNSILRFPSGKFTNDLFQLLPDDLRTVVRTVLRSLRSKKNKVKFENVRNIPGFENKSLNVEGRVFYDEKDEKNYYIISFVESIYVESIDKNVEVIDYQGNFNEKIRDIERELQFTRENLQATVEELETSNEELQSSNEELIASNEELQSTNEELQSVNEELYTVNSEYQNKIDELTVLNNDINNLLKNINVGTLYLDSKLCIRKFTPLVNKLIKLRESDTGRPVTHLNLDYFYPGFIDKIELVLDNLIPIELEASNIENEWYYIKIMPYRNEDNAVDGIIVTFTEISSLKKAIGEKEEAALRLKQALDIGQIAWWEWDLTTNRVVFDDKKATMIGYSKEEFPSDVYEVCKLIHPDDYENVMNEMREYLGGNRPLYDVKYRIRRKSGDYSWYYDRGGVVEKSSEGKPLKLTGVVLDISEIRELQENVLYDSKIINTVIESSPLANTILDIGGNIIFANKAAEVVFDLPKKEIWTRKYDSPTWEISSVDGKPIANKDLPFALVVKTGKLVRDYKHYISNGLVKKLLNITGFPAIDQDGHVFSVYFVIEVLEETRITKEL